MFFALTATSNFSEEYLLIFSREAELLGIHLIGGGDHNAYDPIGWNSQRGLLLANIDLGGLKARPLEDEVSGTDLQDWLNGEVPAVAERNQSCQGGTGLSDGSTLLVLPSGGLILKADGSSVVRVGEPERFGDDFDVLGVHEQGWLLVGEPQVPGVRGHGWSRDDLEDDLEVGFVDLDELEEVEAGTAHPTTEPVDREGQVRQSWLEKLESKFHQFRYVAPPGTDWGAEPSAIAPFPGAHPPRGKADRGLKPARPISRLNGLELGEETITCYTDFGELVAVGYASRRVELFSRRATSSGLITPLALAFTHEPPTSLSLCQRGRTVYLAVLAEQLLWFELTESVSNFSSPVGTGGGRT